MHDARIRDARRFLLPAFIVYCGGLGISGWDFVRVQEGRFTLSVVSVAGLTLLVVGLSIALIAAVTLGRFYSSTLVTRPDHRLVTHGVYSRVRHPIYTGTLLAILGMPICVGSILGFLTLLVLIPLFLGRIRMEESMLLDKFGGEYLAYMQRTNTPIPFVF